jgi:hypothetical protein
VLAALAGALGEGSLEVGGVDAAFPVIPGIVL